MPSNKDVDERFKRIQSFLKTFRGGIWASNILRKQCYTLAENIEKFRDKVEKCDPEAIWYAHHISEELVRLNNEIEHFENSGYISVDEAKEFSFMRYDLLEQLWSLIEDFKNKCVCRLK